METFDFTFGPSGGPRRETDPFVVGVVADLGALGGERFQSIDVDGFDPSVFPGTGTPEPGGLTWYLGLKIIQKLAKARNIVGFDIVEVAPNEGQQVSEFAAARLMGRTIAFVSKYCWNPEGAV